MLHPRSTVILAASLLLLACGSGTEPPSANMRLDATPSADAGASDAGADARDAATDDAGTVDASTADAGTADASTPDAGAADAGHEDAGESDAGTPDAGTPDAGTPDAGPPDGGVVDAGTVDAGVVDSGVVDAGFTDAGLHADGGIVASMDPATIDIKISGPAPIDVRYRLAFTNPSTPASIDVVTSRLLVATATFTEQFDVLGGPFLAPTGDSSADFEKVQTSTVPAPNQNLTCLELAELRVELTTGQELVGTSTVFCP